MTSLLQRVIVPVGLCLLLGLAGCQNNLTVKVEMLDVAPRQVAAHPSTRVLLAALELRDTIENDLGQFTSTALLEVAIEDELPESQEAGVARNLKKDFGDIDAVVGCAAALKDEGERLREENKELLVDEGLAGQDKEEARQARVQRLQKLYLHFAEVQHYAAKVDDLAREAERQYAAASFVHALTTRFTGRDVTQKYERIKHRLSTQIQNLGQVKVSFGGFVVTGVFAIKAGDPYYREVLKADAVGETVFSSRPFAQATVGAAGDTTALIVFDNPVQVRTYEVSNDPTQLIRNIAMIIDKALQAVVKYAPIGV